VCPGGRARASSSVTPARPSVVVFDVNETLTDMEPLRARFVDVGAPAHLLEAWFSATLRDGFALSAAGAYADFAEVAAGSLRVALASVGGLRRSVDEAVKFVLEGLSELGLHADVPVGMRLLHAAGVRLVTLTNGSVALTEAAFARAGVLDLFERRMSVEEVRAWKPAAAPYLYAARESGISVERMALVAVHPWDIDGARRAGLMGGWINRRSRPYPGYFRRPDVSGPDLPAVARALLSLGA